MVGAVTVKYGSRAKVVMVRPWIAGLEKLVTNHRLFRSFSDWPLRSRRPKRVTVERAMFRTRSSSWRMSGEEKSNSVPECEQLIAKVLAAASVRTGDIR